MLSVRAVLIAGMALLALAVGLAATTTASAQGASTATTTLRPGLNLAGWTEAETDAAALFEAIPRLDMAYAWDAGARRFRWAARDGSGDLRTLTPGMGLWLALGGTERFTWTRPMLPPGGIGLVPLREGWNLVTWAGSNSALVAEAFRGLEGVLTEAWGWDAQAQRRTRYVPGVRVSSNALSTLYNGSAYWLRVSGAKHWWQFPPRVEFPVDVTPARQAELRVLVDEVVSFFSERTGIAVPDLTVRFDADRPESCGGSYDGRVGVRVIRVDCPRPLAHEYTHAVQEYSASIEESGRWGHMGITRAPRWLTEGVANYWAHRYHDETSEQTYDGRIQSDIIAVQGITVRLRDLERDLNTGGDPTANYSLGTLSIDWLISREGEASITNFYRQRRSHPDWQSTFLTVFGMMIDDFYDAFEAYRAEIAPPLSARLWGTAVDVDGKPVNRLWVAALRHSGDTRNYPAASTNADGKVSFYLDPDVYRMHVHSDQVSECTVYSSIASEPADSIFSIPRGANVGMRIVVRRATLPEADWFPCGWGGVDETLAHGAE